MTKVTEDVGMMRASNETRKGDWMETYTGVKFYPLDPQIEDIFLIDIAHHLARINRYNGAICVDSYSVGEHAILMADWIYDTTGDALIALQALHHDDPEAYIGDMVRPLKRNMPTFVEAEKLIWLCVADKFGLDPTIHSLVKEADNRILVDERAQVMHDSGHSWGLEHLKPLGVMILGLCPNQVRNQFLAAHHRLVGLLYS